MALHAGDAGVQTGQGEGRELVVIKGGAGPRERRMAERAILRKRGGHVVGVVRGGEIVSMAAKAGDRRSGEPVPDMALRAGQSGVRSGQSKTRDLGVIEPGPLPYVHAVATLTSGGQIRRHMVQRGSCLVIAQVARHALRAQPRIDAGSGAVMTVVAGGGSVCANQRKAVVVIAKRGDLHVPAAYGMAFLAIGSELPAMQIGMALGTASGRFRKVQVHVAPGTRYILV